MAQVTEDQAVRHVVANSEFLAEVARAAPAGSCLWVNCFPGNPDLTDHRNWFGKPYSPERMAHQVDGWVFTNTYFAVAALVPAADAEIRRRKVNFARLLVLVADDVLLEDVQGRVSYVLQTSPGKTQVGILLDADDPDCADLALVSELVTTMATRGMLRADPSGNNVVRYVRLPVGQNQKPRDGGHFAHTLLQWNPDVRLTLADAAAAVGIDTDELRAELKAKPAANAGVGQQEERLGALIASVLRGEGLHESLNQIAASLVATGMAGGAAVNTLRALMENSAAPRDDRWHARYQDIPRSVSTAQEKFARPIALESSEPEGFKLRRAEVQFDVLKPVEWVLDGFLASAQVAVFAGQPGVGKSTVFSSLALVVAGYGAAMGSDLIVSYPRPVVIVSEHADQYEQLFYALCKRHGIAAADLMQRVHIFNAARLTAREIPREVEHLLHEAGESSEPSLVVLDTASASFDVKDENSNAEVGAMLAALKIPVAQTGAPLWIVAHAAKALGREDPEITPRGASAYIGDVHATGSVFRDKNFPNSTFIKSLKNRNEREFSEIEVRTEVLPFRSIPDKHGVIQNLGIRVGVPMTSGEVVRRQAATEAKEMAAALAESARKSKHAELLLELLDDGMSKEALRQLFYQHLEGKSEDTKLKAFRRALERLQETGRMHVTAQGKCYFGPVDNQPKEAN